jgi:hypothetical protein
LFILFQVTFNPSGKINNMEASLKTKHRSANDPAIPLLGIYQKECDSGYDKGICTPMFIAALFTIAKLWK